VCTVLANAVKLWPPPTLVLRGSCNTRTVGNHLSSLFMARIAAAAAGIRTRIARPDCEVENGIRDADVWRSHNPFQLMGRMESLTAVPSLPESVTSRSVCTSPCLTTDGRAYVALNTTIVCKHERDSVANCNDCSLLRQICVHTLASLVRFNATIDVIFADIIERSLQFSDVSCAPRSFRTSVHLPSFKFNRTCL
jgi:hypothetical protein